MSNPYERGENMNIYRLSINGEVVDCHANNTQIYTHSEQPGGDHVYIAHEQTEEGTIATFIWREAMKDQERWEELLECLANVDVRTAEAKIMTNDDLERFYRYFNRYPDIRGLEQRELSERNNKLIAHFGETIGLMLDTAPELFWEHMSDGTTEG